MVVMPLSAPPVSVAVPSVSEVPWTAPVVLIEATTALEL